MLATGLAVCACHQARRVRFTTLAALANELQEAESRRELGRVVGRYAGTELVVLDELGYLNLPEGAAELVFQVISERNERGSLIADTSSATHPTPGESECFRVRPRFSLRPYANRRPRGHQEFNTGSALLGPAVGELTMPARPGDHACQRSRTSAMPRERSSRLGTRFEVRTRLPAPSLALPLCARFNTGIAFVSRTAAERAIASARGRNRSRRSACTMATPGRQSSAAGRRDRYGVVGPCPRALRPART
jgi:hypothetical protein